MTYLEKLKEVLPKADIEQIRDFMCPGEIFGKSEPICDEVNCPNKNSPGFCENICWGQEYKGLENEN